MPQPTPKEPHIKSATTYLLVISVALLAVVGASALLYITPQVQIEIALYVTELATKGTSSDTSLVRVSPSETEARFHDTTAARTATATVDDLSTTPGSPTPSITASDTRTPSPSPTKTFPPPASRTATMNVTSTHTPTRTHTYAPPPVATHTPTRTRTVAPSPPATSTPTPQAGTSSATPPQPGTPTATPPQPGTSTATPLQPSPTATPLGTCSLSGNTTFESTLLALINEARVDHGLAPLTLRNPLTAAARIHSADMACNNFISHTGSDGSRPADRVAAQGYSFTWIGENIYAGGGSNNAPERAFEWWMNSTPHRNNILGPNYQSIGIGYQYGPDSLYRGHFTLVFTRP